MNQFQQKLLASLAAQANAYYWPSDFELGQNVPPDNTYTALPLFNNRAYATTYWNIANDGSAPTSVDSATGLPNGPFEIKLLEGDYTLLPWAAGKWYVRYPASAKRNITFANSGFAVSNHTYNSATQTGQFLIDLTNLVAIGVALVVQFDGGITGHLVVYPPQYGGGDNGCIAGAPDPQFWNADYIRTTYPYGYMRLMDVSQVNGDYLTGNSFSLAVNWSDRPTPANFPLSQQQPGKLGGWPLEWQVDAVNTAGKDAWFNVSILATDDFITKYATYVAQNLAPGKWASFELGNERWNTSPGFWCYRKAGAAGMAEILGCYINAGRTSEFTLPNPIAMTIAVASGIATVTFNIAHGATTGNLIAVYGNNAGYAGLIPATGTTLTITSPTSITYPCTQADMAAVSTATAFQDSGLFALNAASNLCGPLGIGSLYDVSSLWFYRRQWQMAVLVRAAFTAVGRSLTQCKPLIMFSAGTAYVYGTGSVEKFLKSIFNNQPLNSVFTAASVGGYFSLEDGNGSISAGYGLTGTAATSSGSSAQVLAGLREFVDHGFAAYNYHTFVAWCTDIGLEAWAYEIGVDTSPSPGETTAQATAKQLANSDPLMTGDVRDWVQNLQAIGFKKAGWYQCGAGTLLQYGCFNLGRTRAEIDYTTPTAQQGAKFQGLLASKLPAPSAYSRHVVPCAIDAYGYIGNEAVSKTGVTNPAGANLGGQAGPLWYTSFVRNGKSGYTYDIWYESQTPGNVAVTFKGGAASNQVITFAVAGSSALSTITAAAGGVSGGVVGTCTIPVKPGINYVEVWADVNPSAAVPSEFDFALA